jgi:hypothetical protein
MLKKLAVLAVIAVATSTAAQAMPQTQDEWFVDSGRYINGQVPSYNHVPSQNLYLTAGGAWRQGRLIERRSGASVPQGYFTSGRDQMVSTPGS